MYHKLEIFEVLTIDIGGTHIKATVLDQDGTEVKPYQSIETPNPASPEEVLKAIQKLAEGLELFDYLSVGFPGYVKNGIIQTAPNLGSKMWNKFNLQSRLHAIFDKPTKVVNDADLQGAGIVSGAGFEILTTLGTGFGTAFLKDGILFPHIELAHHPIIKNTDYDQYIGDKTLKTIGIEKWNQRMKEVLEILKKVFNYDRLYIGGGNARFINFNLEKNIKIVSNEDGIKGGAKLWKIENDDRDKIRIY